MTCTHYNFPVPEEKMVRVITDTDLCNEADDPFAVVQALLSPKFDNVGVVAAHFGTRDPNGMQKSWQGLKDLTALMQLTVPVLHGAPHALPDAATPVPSEGAKLIIREAMKEDTRPLFVLLLGPLTDLASAYLQEPRIAASGIDRYMDGIYISEKIGAAKPSAKLFEHALRDLGITNRSRVLMVGDDLLADIKGGINAGIDTCWVNFANEENKTGIQPKYTVHSYEELYRVVMEPEELENVGVRNRRHMNEG